MSVAVKIPVRMTLDEFLVWEPGDGLRWQLVDGEPQAMAPCNRTHGALQGELGALIVGHLRDQGGSCVLVMNPGIIPRVQARHNFRIPDLAVTCTPYQAEEIAVADPVLVIEILSPSNQSATWANVWTYTSLPSVREILILRSAVIGAEILRRLPDGSWPAEPESIADGDLVLDSIGFRVPLKEMYRTTRLAQG